MSKTGKITLGIIIAVVVILAMFFVSTYNSLVTGNEQVNTAWAQVETKLQRRLDLIPNLVESVKSAMKQEQKIFGDIAEARTKYAGAKSVNEKAAAAGEFESAFARLLVIMENYPVLKSNDNVQQLMAQLEGTENRVSVERDRYNEAVRDYNLIVKKFPTNVLAGWYGFEAREMFKAAAGAETAPKVDLKLE